MANFVGTFRLGRDAKKVSGSKGDFFSLSLAYDAYVDGETKTQWISTTLSEGLAGNRAPHLTQGSMIFATINNVRPATYEGKDGQVLHLEGRIIDLDFVGGRRRENESSESSEKSDS